MFTITKLRNGLLSVRNALRASRAIATCCEAALAQQKYISIAAVESFYLKLEIPRDRVPHCRFGTKQRLMELHEHDIIFVGKNDQGCVFHHLLHDTKLLVPFAGFDEFVGLCWDVYIDSYHLNIGKRFIVIDIGSNVFYAALAFAQNPLCAKVFCYELIPAIFEQGQTNLELNPRLRGKIDGANMGMYNRRGQTDVTYYPRRAGASGISEKLQEWEWLARTSENDFLTPENRIQLTVPVEDAHSAVKGHLGAYPDHELVIKIDAENSEFEILENLLPLLQRSFTVFVEIHSVATADKIESLLKGKGYPKAVVGMNTFHNGERTERHPGG